MKTIRTSREMRQWAIEQRCAGRTIGFVPTMGALHEGHVSLMREAARQNDIAVASIFVNPTQFAPHEDFDKYPRTFENDSAMAAKAGVQVLYVPTASGMYPEGYATYVNVERLTEGLCGQSRPQFFRGVATVVTKLFNAVLPHRAYFGQKDAQQYAVVKRMARDLDLDVEVIEMPIVREPDGLAMSSRNVYLNADERQRALALSRSLFRAGKMMESGERDAEVIKNAVREGLADTKIDYVELVDADEFKPIATISGTIVLAVAAFVGNTRLIDNIKFTVR